ncbi:UNVERIFIED_CONTAM: Oleosin [Sesamum calycinum]|uniref:Oleosin n=1 Tax=Sesamum calycinum TaxID=2727403 RepID=A0AAW2STE9_9LAMI
MADRPSTAATPPSPPPPTATPLRRQRQISLPPKRALHHPSPCCNHPPSIGGSLLGLAGIILVGTLIGLALATPVFVIFSPILVPAVILFATAVTGFLTSGAFGLTGLSSISWLLNSFRQATGPLDYTKRRMQEAVVAVGDTTKQAGETIKAKAQDEGRRGGGGKT